MGLSKKKLKNKAKQDQRTTPKAKERAKKARQIEGGKKLRESKRAAANLSEKKSDELDGIDSVDELFKSDVFAAGDSDADLAGRGPDAETASDAGSDASSAGAFHDVDGDDDDDEGLPPDLAQLGEGAAHEKELLAIKESDPAFYQFLVENDRQLLDFRAPEEQARESGAEEEEVEDEGAKPATREAALAEAPTAAGAAARVVTLERMQQIHENARTSFTAFKAALTAYHAAIRSIESGGAGAAAGDNEAYEEDVSDKRASKSKRRRKKAQQSLMHISDEAVFSAIIEWTISNIVDLLELHAGDAHGPKKQGPQQKNKKRKRDADTNFATGDGPAGAMLDPTTFSRWPRVKVMASIFWDETFYLFTHLVSPDMLEFLLRQVSSQRALVWLWPFRGVRRKFFSKSCSLWGSASSHTVRLLSFLFIRNSAAMSTVAPKETMPMKRDQTELEAMIRSVLRAFADAASTGYSWRSLSTFRFMENCYIELLRIDDPTTYRVAFVCIRQLAVILRNACVAGSHGGGGTKAASKQGDKQRKRKSLQAQQIQNLVGWPFVRAVHLWTKAIGTLPCLRPLAYPLATITTGALKSRLASMQYFPFVYQCMRCLNRLSASLEVFVPLSAHLLKAFSVLLPAIEKAHRDRKGGSGASPAKAPEIDILLKFTEGQTFETMTLEAVGGSLCFLLTDHLGILSRSPSFPEIVAPVEFHLKKFSKHCRSENLRRQLKQLVASAEAAAGDAIVRREALPAGEVTKLKRFFLFEADNAMAKARAEWLARKEREEKSRIEAEMRPDGPKRPEPAAEEAANGEKDPKKAKKRERQKEKRKLKAQEAAKMEKAKEALSKGPAKEDKVEEMGFSSSDEED